MTLVVARRIGSSICVVSDTLKTPTIGTGDYRHPFKGTLKSIVLRPDLCVSYAGDNRERAYDAINEYCLQKRVLDPSALARDLFRTHSEKQDVEFIVCCLNPAVIYWICDGRLIENETSAQIGDRRAFSVFQTGLHESIGQRKRWPLPPGPDPKQAEFDELCFAMREGMKEVFKFDLSHPYVGGLPIVLYSSKTGFKYMQVTEGYNFAPVSGTTVETSLMRADPTVGTYNCSICSSDEPGIGAIGVYINQAREGGLFFPQRSDDVVRFPNCSPQEFFNSVKAQYGLNLTGPFFTVA